MNPNGLTHAYLLTPDSSPGATGRFRIDAQLAQAAGELQAVLATVSAPIPEQWILLAPFATIVGRASVLDATSSTTPTFTLRHAQDAVPAELADPLMDTPS
jgi:hypothetical protein